jgi:hypothetical protein
MNKEKYVQTCLAGRQAAYPEHLDKLDTGFVEGSNRLN